MKKIASSKRLSSGKYIDLANLSVDQVDLKDIDRALNYIYRFTGHWKDKEPLTVAQHTRLAVHLSKIIFPDDKVVELDVVIHDFAEAYTGDIATPLKKLFGGPFKDYEDEIEQVVYEKFWVADVPHSKEIYESRKICDLLALDIERRNIWSSAVGKDNWPNIPMEGIFSVKEKKELFDMVQKDRIVDLEHMYNTIAMEF